MDWKYDTHINRTKEQDISFSTTCYFTQPPNDPNAITRQQLVLALRKCLAATSIFAPVSIEYITALKHYVVFKEVKIKHESLLEHSPFFIITAGFDQTLYQINRNFPR